MLHFDKREGRYKPWWKQIAVTVHGWSGPAKVRGDGRRRTTDASARSSRSSSPTSARAADFVISRF